MWLSKSFLNDENKEQCFWFIVLLGWIPIIAHYSVFPAFTEQANDEFSILIPQPESYFFEYCHITLLVFFAALVLIFTIKQDHKKSYILASLPLLLASTIPLFNQTVTLSLLQTFLYGLYILSIFISIFIFLRHAHIFSKAFVIFCLLLLVDSIWLSARDIIGYFGFEGSDSVGNIVDGHNSLIGLLYELYTINLFKTFLFIFLFALIRIAYKAYFDNVEFCASLQKSELKSFRTSTFNLWYPVLLIFLFCTLFYNLVGTYYIEPKLVSHVNSENTSLAKVNPAEHPKTIEEAILSKNESDLNEANKELTAYTKKLKKDLKRNTGDAPQKVHDDLNKLMPKRLPGTKTKKCGIDIIVCPIVNGVKSLSNRAYVSTKKRELNKLKKELEVIANDTNLTIDEKATKMDELIKSNIKIMKKVNKTAVNASFKSYSYFSILMLIYTVIILFKTFLIVFSRISFSPNTKNHATFNTDIEKIPQGKIKRVKDKIKFPKTDKNNYYFSRYGITIAGVPPARKTPQFFTAIITRFLHRRLSFNFVRPTKSTNGVTITVAKPAEFVNWKLAKGEKVFFNFADFIGMSENVKIKRFVSLSVSTLLFGQIIYYYVEGPGNLFLKTRAQPAVSPDPEALSGQNSALLVAWNKSVGFKIDASLTKTDTFLSDYHVKPVRKDQLIVLDLSEQRGTSTSAGILRFLKSFILPI